MLSASGAIQLVRSWNGCFFLSSLLSWKKYCVLILLMNVFKSVMTLCVSLLSGVGINPKFLDSRLNSWVVRDLVDMSYQPLWMWEQFLDGGYVVLAFHGCGWR